MGEKAYHRFGIAVIARHRRHRTSSEAILAQVGKSFSPRRRGDAEKSQRGTYRRSARFEVEKTQKMGFDRPVTGRLNSGLMFVFNKKVDSRVGVFIG
jgi:hypothetical protein